jgi:D-apiose dehydrogenase
VIGCGFFAVNHLNAWRDIAGAEIVAICDPDLTRLAEVGDRFAVPARYADAEGLFARERLDFVDIATAAPSHRSLVEQAAAHKVPASC